MTTGCFCPNIDFLSFTQKGKFFSLKTHNFVNHLLLQNTNFNCFSAQYSAYFILIKLMRVYFIIWANMPNLIKNDSIKSWPLYTKPRCKFKWQNQAKLAHPVLYSKQAYQLNWISNCCRQRLDHNYLGITTIRRWLRDVERLKNIKDHESNHPKCQLEMPW